MNSIVQLGNDFAQYAFMHDISPNQGAVFMKSRALMPLDESRFEVLGSPDTVVVYPVEEGRMCFSFMRGSVGSPESSEAAYVRIPFGEVTTKGLEEVGGYYLDDTGVMTTLTDEQKNLALAALRETLDTAAD